MKPQSARVVGVVAVNSPDYVSRVLSLMAKGHTAVPLRREDDQERIAGASVQETQTPATGHGWFEPRYTPNGSDDVAQISFTSGTEGAPKGVQLSHRALLDVVERLQEMQQLTSDVREYVGVPVYHSFGFGRCRAVGSVGGKVFLPEDGFNPLQVAEMLEQGEINALSAVPSLLRTLLDAQDLFSDCGQNLRWMEIGSQYMSAEEKKQLKELFPRARIVQHYGLTEASRSTFLRIDQATDESELESVGSTIGAVEIKLSAEDHIMIRGPHVTNCILIGAERHHPLDEDGFYQTNDRGRLENGLLYFLGRADDVINCGGLKLSPDRLETFVRSETHLDVPFAICKVADRVRGDGILVAYTEEARDHRHTLASAVARATTEAGVNARGAIFWAEVESLPRTSSGKIQRSILSERIKNPEKAELDPSNESTHPKPNAGASDDGTPRNEAERELLAIWEQALGTKNIRVDESFYDVGGDSVTALSVVVRMSRAGIDVNTCRRIFQGATVREIVAADSEPRDQTGSSFASQASTTHPEYLNTLMVNALRGILVGVVICGHWSAGVIERLPDQLGSIKTALAPLLGYGTPGFATVFGLGFGYLYLDKMRKGSNRVWTAMKLGTWILLAGVTLLSAVRFGIRGSELAYSNFFEIFYSVLTFYLVAVPTMPLWGSLINRFPRDRTILVTLGCALVSLGISRVWHYTLADAPQPDGPLRLVRLMLVAKYNYFSMMWGVLAGVAAGVFVRRYDERPRFSRKVALAGVVCVLLALSIGGASGQLSTLTYWPAPLSIYKWPFYFGITLFLLAGLFALRPNYARLSKFKRKGLEAVATIGQLALPFYVIHEGVIPLKNLVESAGMPDGPAILLVMTGFLSLGVWMFRRVHTMFHSS